MPYTRGTDLSHRQREQVKSTFVHRSTYEHPRPQYGGEPRMSDAEWINSHAFMIKKDGNLGRGSAQPEWRAKNPATVDAHTVLKAGKSILARVSRVGNNLVIKPVAKAARVARRAVKRATKRVANPDAKRGQYTVEVGSQHWFVMKGGLQAALKKGVREAGAGGHFHITDGVSAVTRHFKVNDRNKVQEIR